MNDTDTMQLVRERRISVDQLRAAQDEALRANTSLIHQLERMGFLSEVELARFLSRQHRVELVNLTSVELDQKVLRYVSQDVCERHRLIPISRTGSSLVVAMVDPSDAQAIADISFLTGFEVAPVVAAESAILAAVERGFALESYWVDESSTVRTANSFLLGVTKERPEAFRIRPDDAEHVLEVRVDGEIVERGRGTHEAFAAVIRRLAVMAKLPFHSRDMVALGRIGLRVGRGSGNPDDIYVFEIQVSGHGKELTLIGRLLPESDHDEGSCRGASTETETGDQDGVGEPRR